MAMTRSILFLSVILSTAMPSLAEDPPGFLPREKGADLRIGDAVVKPAGYLPAPPDGWEAGDVTYRFVARKHVQGLDARTGRQCWIASAPEHRRFVRVGHDTEYAYFRWYHRREGDGSDFTRIPDGANVLRRLSLADGSWKEPFSLPYGSGKTKAGYERIRNVLAVDSGLVVLSATDGAALDEKPAGHYRVTLFRKGKVAWSRKFDHPPETGHSGDLESLLPLGKDALLCCRPRGPLTALSLLDGKTRWEIPRVWEYTRHHNGKYWDDLIERPEVPAQRPDGRMLAGPYSVPTGDGTARLYITVLRPAGEVDLYEIDSGGLPYGATRLPCGAEDEVYRLPNGLLLPGEKDVVYRFRPCCPGFGSNRGRCDLRWMTKPESVKPERPHLSLGAQRPRASVLAGRAFYRTVDGGWVLRKQDRTLVLPIHRFDVDDGRVTTLKLRVPFVGPARLPDSGWGTITEGELGTGRGCGRQHLCISKLTATDTQLHITVRWKADLSFTLVFSLADLPD